MPELPEVESARRAAERATLGRRIAEVVLDEADDIVLVEPLAAFRALTGREVTGSDRHGKYFWLTFDAGPCLLFHLGMTGSIRVPGVDTLRYKTGPKTDDGAWPPRFSKLELRLDSGGALAFTNTRRLGRLRLLDDPRAVPPVSKLGFDPLLAMPGAASFAARVRRRRIAIKALLLDQKLAAGVGNWIADEVLYHARIDPRRLAADLATAEVEALRLALAEVIRVSVDADAVSDDFPPGWLFHRRWGKSVDATDAGGHPLTFDQIGGRTTAWVPAVQR